MTGIWVRGGGSRGHNGLDDAKGDRSPPLGWGILNTTIFEFAGKALVQAEVILGVEGISGVG